MIKDSIYEMVLRWTADGRALAVAWSGGGVSVWSTFGGLLMCSLGWDYGLNQDLSKYNPLNVYSMVIISHSSRYTRHCLIIKSALL